LNATQIKYARERAERIFNDRRKVITEKHTTVAVTLSLAARMEALRCHRFEVKTPNRNSYYLNDFVKFDDEIEQSTNQKAIDKDVKKLTATYDALIDQLVLGDAEDALRMLKDFEGSH
jgi:hypothetical protein